MKSNTYGRSTALARRLERDCVMFSANPTLHGEGGHGGRKTALWKSR